ncbi:MAG: c-type cytochrome [Paralcaligenes sp.]
MRCPTVIYREGNLILFDTRRRPLPRLFCALLGVGVALSMANACADQTLMARQAASWASSCVTCHGAGAQVKGSSIPALVGRPASEIEQKMRAYAQGNTAGDVMQQIAKGYDDKTVAQIAQWYAHLNPGSPQ